MTVAVQTPITAPTGNGVTTIFPFAFKIGVDADLTVAVNSVAKTLGVDYTVSGAGNANGGSVTFTVAPANGARILIYRTTLLKRDTDYQTGGDFQADTVDADFDRIWLALQEVSSSVTQRALRAPFGETLTDLPAAASRANTIQAYDSSGNPTVLVPTTGTAADVLVQLANASDFSKGDALVGFKRSDVAGAIARTLDTWARDQYISAKDLGCVGDGSTDDYTAAQAAIDAAGALGFGLFWPAGTYVFGTMPVVSVSGTRMLGAGHRITTFKRKAAASIASVMHFGPTSGTSQVNNLEIQGITFDGNAGCTDSVVKLRNVGFSDFKDLNVTNGGPGVHGMRSDTSTTTITTQTNNNHYAGIRSFANGGAGFFFQGEKFSFFDLLRSYSNGNQGFVFKAFRSDDGTFAETTECQLGTLLAYGNTGNGFELDGVEKFHAANLSSIINGARGLYFLTSLIGSSAQGSNSIEVANFVSRNDALGGIITGTGAFVNGAHFANVRVIGFGSNVDAKGIELRAVNNVNFGSVQIVGMKGTAFVMANGTPLGGGTAQCANVDIGRLLLVSNGNVGAPANHGLQILDFSSEITIGRMYSQNNNTTGANFEFVCASTVVGVYVGYARLNPAAAANHTSFGGGDVFISAFRIGGQNIVAGLRDGITAPTLLPAGHAGFYVDGFDGDYKVRFSDNVVKTISIDT